MNRLLLVADDDLNISETLKARLESDGYRVETASDIAAIENLALQNEYAMAILDMKLAAGDGFGLMKKLREIDHDLPVIILATPETIENAFEAVKEGAYVYLTKPFNHRELLWQIKNGIEKSNLSREVKRLRSMIGQEYQIQDMIGKSNAMKHVFNAALMAAKSDSNVFISGERGTGKGMLARALHQMSDRKNQPFVSLHCAAISETLIESELFGLKKNASPDAESGDKGLFCQASGRMIFLDEISEISLSMQDKLLNALEKKEFHPPGAQESVKIDIRIVSTSEKDILKEVENGRFRQDLFYRIHVIPIRIPPLRDRREDIPLLIRHFLAKIAAKTGNPIKKMTTPAMKMMMTHSWLGNVRELENVIECAAAMANSDVIDEGMILAQPQNHEIRFRSFKESRQDFERNYLYDLMKISKGNVSQAAKLAGKYRADLYALLEKYHLNPLDFRKG